MQKMTLMLLMIATCSLLADDREKTPPFEKIYVAPTDMISTHLGTFYRSPTGEEIPVQCICNDACGTYVILIRWQSCR